MGHSIQIGPAVVEHGGKLVRGRNLLEPSPCGEFWQLSAKALAKHHELMRLGRKGGCEVCGDSTECYGYSVRAGDLAYDHDYPDPAPNDPSGGPDRQPSYGVWSNVLKAAGLSESDFLCGVCDRFNPRSANYKQEHPRVRRVTPRLVTLAEAARDRVRAANPGLAPGFTDHDEKWPETGGPFGEGSGTIARIDWLAWWLRAVLDHEHMPTYACCA